MNEPRQFHDDHLDALRAMLDAIANGVGLTTGQIPTPVREVTATEVQEQIRLEREAAAQMRNQLYPVQPTAAEIRGMIDQERDRRRQEYFEAGCLPAGAIRPTREVTATEAVQAMEEHRMEVVRRSRERIRAVFNGAPPFSSEALRNFSWTNPVPAGNWLMDQRAQAEFMVRRAAVDAAKAYVPDPFAARQPWWPDFKHTEFAQKAMRSKARKLVEQFKGNGGRDGCAALNRVEQTEDWNTSMPADLVENCPAPRQITHNDPDRVRLRAQLIE